MIKLFVITDGENILQNVSSIGYDEDNDGNMVDIQETEEIFEMFSIFSSPVFFSSEFEAEKKLNELKQYRNNLEKYFISDVIFNLINKCEIN